MKLHLFGGRLVVHVLLIPVAVLMVAAAGVQAAAAFAAALLLHEGAHALFASALGVRVLQMELFPFGCAAHLEDFSSVSASKEAAIAAAGPLFNLVCAASAGGVGQLLGEGSFLRGFTEASAALAAVNLLPALPLDGGRLLCALLESVLPAVRARRLCGVLGAFFSVLMLALTVLLSCRGAFNPTLPLMGGFLFYGSVQTVRRAPAAALLQGARREQVLRRRTLDVRPLAAGGERRAGELLPRLDGRRYNLVYVLDEQMRVAALLDEQALRRGLLARGSGVRLRELTGSGKGGII